MNPRLSLLADFDQAFLNRRFDLPEISRLTDKAAAVAEVGKKMRIMLMEISEEITVAMKFEEFAADFHGNDLFISERQLKAAVAQLAERSNNGVVLDNQAVNGDDKGISIYRVSLL